MKLKLVTLLAVLAFGMPAAFAESDMDMDEDTAGEEAPKKAKKAKKAKKKKARKTAKKKVKSRKKKAKKS